MVRRTLFSLASAGLIVGIVAGLCLVGLIVATNWDRWIYLWFEMPQVKAEVSRIRGLSVIKIDDIGPSDEVHVNVTILVDGKGELTVTELTLHNLKNHNSLGIIAIGNCTFTKDVVRMSLDEAIEKYDELYARAQSNYCVSTSP
jgi:hypothetical protein